MDIEVDEVMRALWDARTGRITSTTDEEWARYKLKFRASMSILRQDAIEMIEDGEFD